MDAEEAIKQAVGTLYSVGAPQPLGGIGVPMGGRPDSDTELNLLKQDVRGLHAGLLEAARQIKALRTEIGSQ